MAASANGLAQVAGLRDVCYAPGVHAQLVPLGKLKGQGCNVHLCDGGMELRNRDVDLFANVAKVNNVYPVGVNVTPPRTALAACTTDGDDTEPTHDELVEGLVDLAPTPGSPVFQDCGCISRERREWYGDYGPTGEEMRALHVSQRKQYTSRIRNSVVAQKNTWVAGPMQVKSASGRDCSTRRAPSLSRQND